MAQYYNNLLSIITPGPLKMASVVGGNTISELPKMSKFNRHYQTLLLDNTEEGWASELCHYLGTIQQDVKKGMDIIE